jgi:hypothetical protein
MMRFSEERKEMEILAKLTMLVRKKKDKSGTTPYPSGASASAPPLG